jgi:hypothetical protein
MKQADSTTPVIDYSALTNINDLNNEIKRCEQELLRALSQETQALLRTSSLESTKLLESARADKAAWNFYLSNLEKMLPKFEKHSAAVLEIGDGGITLRTQRNAKTGDVFTIGEQSTNIQVAISYDILVPEFEMIRKRVSQLRGEVDGEVDPQRLRSEFRQLQFTKGADSNDWRQAVKGFVDGLRTTQAVYGFLHDKIQLPASTLKVCVARGRAELRKKAPELPAVKTK